MEVRWISNQLLLVILYTFVIKFILLFLSFFFKMFDFVEFHWNDQRGIDEVCKRSILATIALDFLHFILGIMGGATRTKMFSIRYHLSFGFIHF